MASNINLRDEIAHYKEMINADKELIAAMQFQLNNTVNPDFQRRILEQIESSEVNIYNFQNKIKDLLKRGV